jgi:diaminopimelate decarboxylase
VFVAASFVKEVEALAPFVMAAGLPELNVGGGLGVPYVEGERAPSISEWAAAVRAACRENRIAERVRLTAEPGRAIVATAAVTLYRVGTIKELPGIRTYVSVDGGMSDNPRPVLYGSGYEAFLPRATLAERSRVVTVVGKHCESGDVIVHDVHLHDPRPGDLLVTPATGAYGHALANNYNGVPRPPVIFCRDGTARAVVRRETYDDLLARDLD